MDLHAVWNDDTRLDEFPPFQAVWPDEQRPEHAQNNTAADTTATTFATAATTAGPSSHAHGWSRSSTTSNSSPIAARQELSRFAGLHFNKPHGMEEKSPPKLMGASEIESTHNFELYRMHSTTFELNKGDTLVIIDYPVAKKYPAVQTDCNGILFKSQEFRVHSENLLKTNSSKFKEMLGPTYQFKTMRRRKLVNKLPEEIKYVLDLTPPSEGDELVFQMTELSLTPGITKWWSSSILHHVDSWLVCGHDDVCACAREPPADTLYSEDSGQENSLLTEVLPLDPEKILRLKATGKNELYHTPLYRRISDYCPIRHRNGIIRLLMLIEGKPALLDSAPRVWTLTKLSKMLDCTSVIRDRITQWIMHGYNTRFVEVLPEEALQIAFALELPEIAQSTFRILVNELAIVEADTRPNKPPTQTTFFGRRKGDLPDELSNLVQHSARALVERVTGTLSLLENPDILNYWTFQGWNFEEWNRLRAIEQLLAAHPGLTASVALATLRKFMSALSYVIMSAVGDTIDQIVNLHDAVYKSIDQDRATYTEPKDFELLAILRRQMNPAQLFLCSVAYNELGSELDSSMFVGHWSKHEDSEGISYDKLCNDTRLRLQEVINENPMLAYTQEWRVCFNETVPARFIRQCRQVRTPIASLQQLQESIRKPLEPICLSWLRRDIEPPLNITRHLLLTLNNDEMKFLPLWAGGCDDGTGGVFEAQIPPTEMGPNGPGPSYHTGLTIGSQPSSVCGSIMEDLAEMKLRGSTIAESIAVHDSISTVYRPSQVIADDESVVSEAFTVGASDYQTARFDVPVDGQSMASAVNQLVETTDSETQSMTGDDQMTWEVEDDDGNESNFWDEQSDSDDSVVMVDANHAKQ